MFIHISDPSHRFSYTYGRERINLILRYRVIYVILLPLVRKYTVRKNHTIIQESKIFMNGKGEKLKFGQKI